MFRSLTTVSHQRLETCNKTSFVVFPSPTPCDSFRHCDEFPRGKAWKSVQTHSVIVPFLIHIAKVVGTTTPVIINGACCKISFVLHALGKSFNINMTCLQDEESCQEFFHLHDFFFPTEFSLLGICRLG